MRRRILGVTKAGIILVMGALGLVTLVIFLSINMPSATVTFVKPKTPAKDAWALAVTDGEQLFKDKKLLGVERSCAECHMVEGGKLSRVAATYPKYAEAVKKVVTFGQRINYCILATGGDPLPWDSDDLASLAAYVSILQ